MITFPINFFSKHIIILGEIHGTKENIRVVDRIIRTQRISILGIEVDTKYTRDFQFLRQNTVQTTANRICKEDSWLFEAGVLSLYHLQFFAKLREQGIQVVPIKSENKNWNQAEKKTAEQILRVCSANNGRCLILVGSLHARKKVFSLREGKKKKIYKPLGWLLRNQVQNAQIRYGRGSAINFGRIRLADAYVMEKLGKKGVHIQKSHSRFFDYDILVRDAAPILQN